MISGIPLQLLEHFHSHCKDKKTLSLKELQTFLKTAQRDPQADDQVHVLEVFKDYTHESTSKLALSKKPTVSMSLPDVSACHF